MGIEYAKTSDYFSLETEEEKHEWCKSLITEQKAVIEAHIAKGEILDTLLHMDDMMEFYKAYVSLLQLIDHFDQHREHGEQMKGCGLAEPILDLRDAFMSLGQAIDAVEKGKLHEKVKQFLKEQE